MQIEGKTKPALSSSAFRSSSSESSDSATSAKTTSSSSPLDSAATDFLLWESLKPAAKLEGGRGSSSLSSSSSLASFSIARVRTEEKASSEGPVSTDSEVEEDEGEGRSRKLRPSKRSLEGLRKVRTSSEVGEGKETISSLCARECQQRLVRERQKDERVSKNSGRIVEVESDLERFLPHLAVDL